MAASNNRKSGSAFFEPGQWVRHPGHPEWGDGQIQSSVQARVTVMFEHAGKVMINSHVVLLEPVHR